MFTAQLTFENASACPLFGPLALPWLGHLEATLTAPLNGAPVFAYDRPPTAPLPEHQVRLGRLQLTFWQDASLRPSWFAWTALAFVAGNVAGWTEGHLWRLF